MFWNGPAVAKKHLPANFQIVTRKISSSAESLPSVYCKSGLRTAIPDPKMAQTMEPKSPNCTILADRHVTLVEGIRDLLETAFQTVYLVSDTSTLRDGALRLLPALIVLDLSLAGHDVVAVLREIRDLSPATRVLVLTVYDEPSVARMAMDAGAHGIVIKRCIGNDLMPAVDALLRGEEYVSLDFGLGAAVH